MDIYKIILEKQKEIEELNKKLSRTDNVIDKEQMLNQKDLLLKKLDGLVNIELVKMKKMIKKITMALKRLINNQIKTLKKK